LFWIETRPLKLEGFSTVHEQGYGSGIGKGYIHHCLKNAALHPGMELSDGLDEIPIELFGLSGRRGIGIRWTAAFSAVSVKCELGNKQQFPADILKAQVQLTFLVVEKPEFQDFVRHPLQVRGSVLSGDAYQGENPPADACDLLASHCYGCAIHSLEYSPHAGFIRAPGNRACPRSPIWN
jgi:hypothetical protein